MAKYLDLRPIRVENPEEPYPGMPRYCGDYLDAMLGRPWGWSEPVMQQRYFEAKKKRDRVRSFVKNLEPEREGGECK